MDLENALETARRLRDALAHEVESARSERQLLKALDSKGLFARVAARNAFLMELARQEHALARSLSNAAGTLDLPEVTLDRIIERAPVQGAALEQTFSEIRSLAASLRELDQLNAQLAGRALTCVRGFLDALSPVPRAYDRRGARESTPSFASVSSKG